LAKNINKFIYLREDSSKIRNERGEVTTETQSITRGYYEQLYSNKLVNLEEMDEFLEIYKLLRLNHDKTENLNRLITSKKIESLLKNLPGVPGWLRR